MRRTWSLWILIVDDYEYSLLDIMIDVLWLKFHGDKITIELHEQDPCPRQ
jgi:hypothetical protein